MLDWWDKKYDDIAHITFIRLDFFIDVPNEYNIAFIIETMTFYTFSLPRSSEKNDLEYYEVVVK